MTIQFKRFKRRPQTSSANTHEKPVHPPLSYQLNKRPTFGEWARAVWADIICLCLLGAVGLGAFVAAPAAHRYFPITFNDGEVVYPTFAYPYRSQIVASWLSGFIAIVPPICIFIVFQIRHRSFWDLNNAIFGLLYSNLLATSTQVILKWAIGGLRPHFLSVCKPVIPAGLVGQGFQQIMFDRAICTGDVKEINNALQSFPSGHTTSAFAGFLYLSLYFNAKFKIFANFHPQFWKLFIFFVPLVGAALIGGSVTIDYYHNWYDVVGGGVIGIIMAFAAFRSVYASVWDWRFNHIPLTRGGVFASTPLGFSYDLEGEDYDSWHEVVSTRKAGWGRPRLCAHRNQRMTSSASTSAEMNGLHDGPAGRIVQGRSEATGTDQDEPVRVLPRVIGEDMV